MEKVTDFHQSDKNIYGRKISHLVKMLPDPVYAVASGDIHFEVYRVKGFSPRWGNPLLRALLKCARESYRCYGHVPLFNAYDKKSYVYLARSRYPVFLPRVSKRYAAEEWLSMKFVPGSGSPEGTEDLYQCMYRKKPLAGAVQKILFNGDPEYVKKIISMSHVCKIAPYFSSEYDAQNPPFSLPSRLAYTASLFALIHEQFIKDMGRDNYMFEYITGLFHDELINKALTIKTDKNTSLPYFSYAYKVLGFENPAMIRLDRKYFAYAFPLYFLNTEELISLFEHLMNNGTLTQKTLALYTGARENFKNVMRDNALLMVFLKHTGQLLTVQGKIAGSPLTGNKLRALVDRRVSDALDLHLRMMKMSQWEKSIGDTLGFLSLTS